MGRGRMMARGFLWDGESVLEPVWDTDATEWFKSVDFTLCEFHLGKKKHSSGWTPPHHASPGVGTEGGPCLGAVTLPRS